MEMCTVVEGRVEWGWERCGGLGLGVCHPPTHLILTRNRAHGLEVGIDIT